MPRPVPVEKAARAIVVSLLEGNERAAEKCSVSLRTVQRWRKSFDEDQESLLARRVAKLLEPQSRDFLADLASAITGLLTDGAAKRQEAGEPLEYREVFAWSAALGRVVEAQHTREILESKLTKGATAPARPRPAAVLPMKKPDQERVA
jgi:hypothetical protein